MQRSASVTSVVKKALRVLVVGLSSLLGFSLWSVVSGDLGAEKDFKRLVLPQRTQRTQRRDLKDYLITHHFQLWLGQAPQTLVLAIGIAENALVR